MANTSCAKFTWLDTDHHSEDAQGTQGCQKMTLSIFFSSAPKTSYEAKAKMTAGSPDLLPCLSKKNQASKDEHEGENITSTESYFKKTKRQ